MKPKPNHVKFQLTAVKAPPNQYFVRKAHPRKHLELFIQPQLLVNLVNRATQI